MLRKLTKFENILFIYLVGGCLLSLRTEATSLLASSIFLKGVFLGFSLFFCVSYTNVQFAQRRLRTWASIPIFLYILSCPFIFLAHPQDVVLISHLVTSIMLILLVATVGDLRSAAEAICRFGVFLALLNLMTYGFGIFDTSGRWGAAWNPQHHSLMLCLTLPFVFFSQRLNTVFKFVIVALMAVFIILSQSRTAYVVLAVFAVIFCFKFEEKNVRMDPLKGAFLLIILLVFIPYIDTEWIISRDTQFGHIATFSSRTLIWPVQMERVIQEPFIGFGDDIATRIYAAGFLHKALGVHAHNLYLHLAIQQGIPRMLIITTLLLTSFARLSYLTFNRSTTLIRSFLPPMWLALVTIIIFSIVEHGPLDPTSFYGSMAWVIMVLGLMRDRSAMSGREKQQLLIPATETHGVSPS